MLDPVAGTGMFPTHFSADRTEVERQITSHAYEIRPGASPEFQVFTNIHRLVDLNIFDNILVHSRFNYRTAGY